MPSRTAGILTRGGLRRKAAGALVHFAQRAKSRALTAGLGIHVVEQAVEIDIGHFGGRTSAGCRVIRVPASLGGPWPLRSRRQLLQAAGWYAPYCQVDPFLGKLQCDGLARPRLPPVMIARLPSRWRFT
jgi:hypothetical protein